MSKSKNTILNTNADFALNTSNVFKTFHLKPITHINYATRISVTTAYIKIFSIVQQFRIILLKLMCNVAITIPALEHHKTYYDPKKKK